MIYSWKIDKCNFGGGQTKNPSVSDIEEGLKKIKKQKLYMFCLIIRILLLVQNLQLRDNRILWL